MQFAPVLTQIALLEHGPEGNWQEALRNIFCCVKVVEFQQGLYPSADWARSLIGDMLSRAGIETLTQDDNANNGLKFRGALYTPTESPIITNYRTSFGHGQDGNGPGVQTDDILGSATTSNSARSLSPVSSTREPRKPDDHNLNAQYENSVLQPFESTLLGFDDLYDAFLHAF